MPIGAWVARNKTRRGVIDFVAEYGELLSAPTVLLLEQWQQAYESWRIVADRNMQRINIEKTA